MKKPKELPPFKKWKITFQNYEERFYPAHRIFFEDLILHLRIYKDAKCHEFDMIGIGSFKDWMRIEQIAEDPPQTAHEG